MFGWGQYGSLSNKSPPGSPTRAAGAHLKPSGAESRNLKAGNSPTGQRPPGTQPPTLEAFPPGSAGPSGLQRNSRGPLVRGGSRSLNLNSRAGSGPGQQQVPENSDSGDESDQRGGILGTASSILGRLGMEERAPDEEQGILVWEVEVAGGWVRLDAETSQLLTQAQAEGRRSVQNCDARSSQKYMVDLERLEQTNQGTGEKRGVRCTRVAEDPKTRRSGGRGRDILEALRRLIAARSALLLAAGVALIVASVVVASTAASAGGKPQPGSGGGGSVAPAPSDEGWSPAPPAATTPALAPTQPPLVPIQPGQWYMCTTLGQCGSAPRRTWSTDPTDLVGAVAGFNAAPPGVSAQAWGPVAAHWSASTPVFQGTAVQLGDIAAFVVELLGSDPFGTGGKDIPFVDLRPPSENKVVAVTQRQLAFLVANALMGNGFTDGGSDGLTAGLQRCGANPAKSTYLYSLLSFLAVLSRELAPGDQGSLLVAATPKGQDKSWKNNLGTRLPEPTVCQRQADGSFDCGLSDFMAGGTQKQALTDIAGGVVGGGAQLCDLAASQDESLVQFYSEVLAFSFFTNGANKDDSATGMLPVPWVLLGARRYMNQLSGNSMGGSCGAIPTGNWLNEAISSRTVPVSVGGTQQKVAPSAFVGVASVCSACNVGDSCSHEELINNKCDLQRRHLEQDLSNWYQAFEPAMYEPSVQQAFRSVVSRIGTGPWGAGVWYGDSQQSFLTVWLATSLLSGITLDYYIYPSFCENQGNQCFVLGTSGGCGACVEQGALPGAGVDPGSCGPRGITDIISQFKGRSAQELYDALLQVGQPPDQIFDLLHGSHGI
mmetsp:Transcript_21952/g.71104  ORF Transcript_21952/g.71104 Transcript_21952/m.71104 type:complete len:828 (-) Transcript_21952:74-2557(-)